MDWWEKAAEEALEFGVDPAQALRLFMKAEAAAQALQGRMQQHMADSALSLGPHMAAARAGGSFNKATRYPFLNVKSLGSVNLKTYPPYSAVKLIVSQIAISIGLGWIFTNVGSTDG